MKESTHNCFTELEVWKKTRFLKIVLIQLTKRFPAHEKFKLTDQIIKSSRSIGACVAEGYGRFSFKDQLHFCIMARGSLSETLNHLFDCMDCNYLNEIEFNSLVNKIREIEKLLNGYISYLRKNIV